MIECTHVDVNISNRSWCFLILCQLSLFSKVCDAFRLSQTSNCVFLIVHANNSKVIIYGLYPHNITHLATNHGIPRAIVFGMCWIGFLDMTSLMDYSGLVCRVESRGGNSCLVSCLIVLTFFWTQTRSNSFSSIYLSCRIVFVSCLVVLPINDLLRPI